MALQLLNMPNRSASLGESFGQALGGGLAGGLYELAEHKTRKLQEQNLEQGLTAAGYSKELAKLPLPILQSVMANIGQQRKQEQQNQLLQQQLRGVEAMYRGISGQSQQPQNEIAQSDNMPQQSYNSLPFQQQARESFDNNALANLLGKPTGLPTMSGALGAIPSMQSNQSPQPQAQQLQQANAPDFSAIRFAPNLHEAARFGQSVLKQQTNQKKESQRERELESKQSEKAREFSKPYREKSDASRRNIKVFDQLINLAEKGDIRSGNAHIALEKLGLEGFNRNIDTEVASKLLGNLALNIGSAYPKGTRLTNFLESVFQRQLPTLWNTPEGMVAVAKLYKNGDKGNVYVDDVRRELMKQWKGNIPYNAEDIIEGITRPYLDQLDEQSMNTVRTASFPSAKKTPPNKKIEMDGTIYGIRDGEWVPISQG